MSHDNVFRKHRLPSTDLSKLPPTAREAFTSHVPERPGEIRANVTILHTVMTVPNARIISEIGENANKERIISLRMLDYTGIKPLGQIEIAPEVLPPLIKRLEELAKRISPVDTESPTHE